MQTLDERLAKIERELLPDLLEYPGIGWTSETEELIETIRPVIIEAGREDLLAQVEEVEEWLGTAKSQEAVHGKDYLFHTDHPLIQDAIAFLTEGTWEMKLSPESRRPIFQ